MKIEKSTLLIITNTITLLIMLFVNYASNAGVISSVSVGDISHKYDTLFAPAGYAFSIWGIIFLLLLAFVIFQWTSLKNKARKEFVHKTGIWFSLSNIANSLWIYFWLHEQLGWSVAIILILLATLIILTYKLRLELDDEPASIILFVWWPIVIYLGWIMVATIACIAAYLVSINWSGGLTPQTWTIIMVFIASILYLYLLKTRNLREAAAVGIWAFVAIAIRQWSANINVAIVALICSFSLLIAISIHGYINRKYSLIEKLKE